MIEVFMKMGIFGIGFTLFLKPKDMKMSIILK